MAGATDDRRIRNNAHGAAVGLTENRAGFTLIELLVAIGIIALLAALLLPFIGRAMTSAGRQRAQSDLSAISSAIEAYRQDFGDIPRVSQDSTGLPWANNGAAILGKALIGPYGTGLTPADPPPFNANAPYKPGDCVIETPICHVALIEMSSGSVPATTDTTAWAWFDPRDGADGPGFKTRTGASKVSGPYLPPDKIKTRGVFLYDNYNMPILYFPGRPGRIDVTVNKNYIDNISNIGGSLRNPMPLYNAADNLEAFRHGDSKTDPASNAKMAARIQIMLGDTNYNGIIDSGETAISKPFLLWSAGPDQQFGPVGLDIPTGTPSADQITAIQKAVSKCDDVTNFRD